jgi:hypothetical protein
MMLSPVGPEMRNSVSSSYCHFLTYALGGLISLMHAYV